MSGQVLYYDNSFNELYECFVIYVLTSNYFMCILRMCTFTVPYFLTSPSSDIPPLLTLVQNFTSSMSLITISDKLVI